MCMSMSHRHMRSLLELKQTGTVVEYTTAFWERLHHVLDLNPDLHIKGFVHQYVDGLRDDIQAAVRSRSPSSITSASSLARIREDEIGKDEVMGANKVGVSDGLMPMENLTDVFPEPAAPMQCRAGHIVTTIDVSCCSALTPSTCSMDCLSSNATVDVFPKLAASAESDVDLDTVSVAALTTATCSTGGLAHGRDGDSLAAASLVLSTMTLAFKLDVTPSIKQQGQMLRPLPWPSFVAKQPSTSRSGIIESPLSVTTASSRIQFLDTMQPAQLDYLVPSAKPPDSSEGCATKVSCESRAWFSTRGVKGIGFVATNMMLDSHTAHAAQLSFEQQKHGKVHGDSHLLERLLGSNDEMFQAVSTCHENTFSSSMVDVSVEGTVFELLPSWRYGGFSPGITIAKSQHLLHCSSRDHFSVHWEIDGPQPGSFVVAKFTTSPVLSSNELQGGYLICSEDTHVFTKTSQPGPANIIVSFLKLLIHLHVWEDGKSTTLPMKLYVQWDPGIMVNVLMAAMFVQLAQKSVNLHVLYIQAIKEFGNTPMPYYTGYGILEAFIEAKFMPLLGDKLPKHLSPSNVLRGR